jgi:hypothetical protein
MEQKLLNELNILETSIANYRRERKELQSYSFSDYFDTIFYRDFDGDMVFDKWYNSNLENVKQISKVNIQIEQMDNQIQETDVRIRNIRKELKHIQQKYSATKYFDKDRLRAGMLVEFDHTGGLNSSGVTYYLTKVTKTYVLGYSIIGGSCGDIRKITKPNQLVLIF